MNTHILSLLALGLVALAQTAPLAVAKDKEVTLEECPAPVQATIKQYTAHGTLDEIGLDEKKKSGGPAVYEAKINLKDGRRIEVHISPSGQIITVEEKKPKN